MGRPGGRVNGRTDIIIAHLILMQVRHCSYSEGYMRIFRHGENKINGAHAAAEMTRPSDNRTTYRA